METLEQMKTRFHNEREQEFKRNKQNIYVRLSGSNKYYYAWQCQNFTRFILENGFNNYKPNEIDSVYFDNHSITIRLNSTAETDIKRFDSKKEMLSYVVGFNDCLGVK
tara:strand:- start:260 stop:583 length:324 start_codon:yes stop_codon:yes gene_type:complete